MNMTDRFGNQLEPGLGFARGRHLRSSVDEVRRLRHAQAVAAAVVSRRGPNAIGIFTGNSRYFPLRPEDLETLCEEWIGPGLFAHDLDKVAIEHMGGLGDEMAAVTNRTSAGIIAAILALSLGRTVLSIVPDGDRSHASVNRGCRLAGVELVEVEARSDMAQAVDLHRPALVVVTTVTSTLARLDDSASRAAIGAAKQAGAIVLLDEAYGARLRPVLHGGAKSLSLGCDLAITNADKAGLSGPRAGVIVGKPAPVRATMARASELGMEARAPIAAGAMRSLQLFDPEDLKAEARDGAKIADILAARFGERLVHRSDLGPMMGEEDVLEILLDRAGRKAAAIVPAEATAAVAMLLLADHGVLTVNTHGQPGARVSLRLKPTAGALDRVGGAEALVDALEQAFRQTAAQLDDHAWFCRTLFGDEQ